MDDIKFYKKRDTGLLVQDLYQFFTANLKDIVFFNIFIIMLLAVLGYYYLNDILTIVISQNFESIDTSSFVLYILTLFLLTVLQLSLNFEFIILKEDKLDYSIQLLLHRTFKNLYKYIIWFIFFVMLMIPIILVGIIPIIGWFFFVYISVTFIPLFFILRKDNLDFFEGIKECMIMIKNKWWPTFGAVFILMIIYMIFSLIINLIFGTSVDFEGLMLKEEIEIDPFQTVMANILNYVVYIPFYYLPAFIYYSNKEDHNLFDRISNIGDEE